MIAFPGTGDVIRVTSVCQVRGGQEHAIV